MLKYLIIILVVFLVVYVFTFFRTRAKITFLTQDQFIEGYRKAQLIDVREPSEFDRGYIRGARNVPMTQLKQRLIELRKDKPVYLYCQNSARSVRAANMLRKKGYNDLNVLQGGFRKWTGKIDAKK
ncbi:MAG TPA: rhodanese-like domain-containing protein [Pseudogracilibacillus sp.]|nr:rhodanese-like domain-containing protein [Pseudogracilibacillus sp.]